VSPRNYVTTKNGTRYTPPEAVCFGNHEMRLMEVIAPNEHLLEAIKQQAASKGWWVYVEGERNDGLLGLVFAQDIEPDYDDDGFVLH
jgi:hypothetical protein